MAGRLSSIVLFLGCLAALAAEFRAGANPALEPPPAPIPNSLARFEVKVSPDLLPDPASGRLLVILGSSPAPEPRFSLGETGLSSPPRLGRDVTNLAAREVAIVDRRHALFPQAQLGAIPPGVYFAQAVLMTNRDLWLTDAPGNLVSEPVRIQFDPRRRRAHQIELSRRLPAETLPADTEQLRFLKIRSEKLSQFWGRPMYLRAGVVLPRDWENEPARRYPLIVQIGGFGTRYDSVVSLMKPGGRFHEAWMATNAPRFILLQLDGAGPLGDPYQVNSDNHGPYGDALVEELLPYAEAAYRAVGQPHARLLTGGSTGGWVSLALQVFYPNVFGGCWSGFPDPPDFRALQLVNLYADTNAFVTAAGFERPCAREINGDTRFTMRHETQLENVLGLGDSYVYSGGQWGSWNATYSPRAANGAPRPIWDPRSGAIDASVAAAWRRYDLREALEKHWIALAPALRGKIRIWMGDADDYFLDTATRLLDGFLRQAEPPAEARVEFAAREPHGWMPRSWGERLPEMEAAVNANAPKPAAAAHDAYLRARFMPVLDCPHCQYPR